MQQKLLLCEQILKFLTVDNLKMAYSIICSLNLSIVLKVHHYLKNICFKWLQFYIPFENVLKICKHQLYIFSTRRYINLSSLLVGHVTCFKYMGSNYEKPTIIQLLKIPNIKYLPKVHKRKLKIISDISHSYMCPTNIVFKCI